MARSAPRRRERRLEALQRRIEYLQAALARDLGCEEYDRRAEYQRAEVSALQWAVAVLREAIQRDAIEHLERSALLNDTLPNGFAAAIERLFAERKERLVPAAGDVSNEGGK